MLSNCKILNSVKSSSNNLIIRWTKSIPELGTWTALVGNIIKTALICLIWKNFKQRLFQLGLSSVGDSDIFFGNILTLANYQFCKVTGRLLAKLYYENFVTNVLWRFLSIFQLNCLALVIPVNKKCWLNTALTLIFLFWVVMNVKKDLRTND